MNQTFRALVLALASVLLFASSGTAQISADPDPKKANMAEVVEAAMQPLEADAEVNYKASSLATAEVLLATTVPNGTPTQQTRRYSQEIVVENLHASISVCVYSVVAGAACTTDADASCRGGADPKLIVAPSKSRKFRFAGTRQPCAITSAVAGEWQAERVIALVGAR